MEKVLCSGHGVPCGLKTGSQDGPSKGKSFYMCIVKNQPCDFMLQTNLSCSHCLVHNDYIVDLQVLIKQEKTDLYRLFYRCSKGKMEGKKMCGNVPWQDKTTTKLPANPQAQHTLELLRDYRDQRNPFKISSRNYNQFFSKQMNDSEDKSLVGNKKEQGEAQKFDGEDWPKLKSRSVMKEFGDKFESLSREETETQAKPKDSWTEMCLSNKHRGCSSKISELSSSHMQRNSSMRPIEDDLQINEWPEESLSNLGSHKSSLKHINGEQLGRKGLKICGNKPETMETIGKWKAKEKTLMPKENVTVQESKCLPEEYAGGNLEKTSVLLQRGQIPKEKKITKKWTNDEEERLVSFKVPVGQGVTSQLGKNWKNLPPISPEGACLHMADSVDFKVDHCQLLAQLQQKQRTLKTVNVQALPDKGERLLKQVQELETLLSSCNLEAKENIKQVTGSFGRTEVQHGEMQSTLLSKINMVWPDPATRKELQPFHKDLVPSSFEFLPPLVSEDSCTQAICGGRITDDSLTAVHKATTDAISQLHKSLESCPTEETVIEDPPGLTVSLLLHQKQALSWLIWRENQKPCGGILADDMGLGKTLTMIALILAQQCAPKKKGKGKKLELWLSKQDSTVISSHGTLIVCPASLIHHWKKEVERRVKYGKLKVCLYHGPSRVKSTTVLSQYEIVITTYSILAKEVCTQEADSAAEDHVLQDKSSFSPLVWIHWARIVLDEAHNIKNPKVQASMAAYKLKATARWAVTGTPIQNNLLDMYSLLRFLRCSPFDEFKIWQSQVDNNTKKGGERLMILTKSLLLRRTKDQLDSSGKPLVSLPQRSIQFHRLRLTEDEQSVYDVLFKRSRSTLQSYLKQQETQSSGYSGKNPFDIGVHRFKGNHNSSVKMVHGNPPVSTTVHILSLLLRLRQCCCHLSLLKVALDQANMNSEGISLSLEEQLSALTLSEPDDSSDPKSVLYVFGTAFGVDLFEKARQSSKLSRLLKELKVIQSHSQKCVIVSQWTSMLKVVGIHLEKLGLKYATVDGSVNPKQRMDVVEQFNNNPRGPTVLLISLLAGGVGLNLVGGNHLFLLDMHWNPALEDQACDRIYRVGQKKDVTIHRFVCEGTVEENILKLQTKKKELAQKVLSGKGDSFSKLTLADLKLLFGI